jgi:hypothetical protein
MTRRNTSPVDWLEHQWRMLFEPGSICQILNNGRKWGGPMGSIRPATTMVEVKRSTDPDMLIEIEADAITAGANPHT